MDGAIAALCDPCLQKHPPGDNLCPGVYDGFPDAAKVVPVYGLPLVEFDHDLAYHQEVTNPPKRVYSAPVLTRVPPPQLRANIQN
jgi:hypothetical protein